MLLGRLRGATSQQLGEAARQLGARLQRHQAALAAGLTAAIERGGGLLVEAEDRRDQRAAELDRAAERLHSVAAWLQPPPLPPRTSQPGTPEWVQ
ncbi:MAG TPA: hypothetical protein VG035_03500 [Actinomycetota bacterium]|nr:hypothetical protein [Actinomycetota bacterium]